MMCDVVSLPLRVREQRAASVAMLVLEDRKWRKRMYDARKWGETLVA